MGVLWCQACFVLLTLPQSMAWAWIPDTKFGKGKGKSWSKGGGKSKGKASTLVKKVKGKGKGKRSGEKRVPYSDLSEEKKAEIRAKHDERAEREGRETVDDTMYEGTLERRNRYNGWIKPLNPGKLPATVKQKLAKMTQALKKKVIEKGYADQFEKSNLIYLRMCDVTEGVKVDTGMKLQFKIYTDEEGVGACDV